MKLFDWSIKELSLPDIKRAKRFIRCLRREKKFPSLSSVKKIVREEQYGSYYRIFSLFGMIALEELPPISKVIMKRCAPCCFSDDDTDDIYANVPQDGGLDENIMISYYVEDPILPMFEVSRTIRKLYKRSRQ